MLCVSCALRVRTVSARLAVIGGMGVRSIGGGMVVAMISRGVGKTSSLSGVMSRAAVTMLMRLGQRRSTTGTHLVLVSLTSS